jgi:hypothetical protein
MMPCCALAYPTESPIWAETVHATSHVTPEPVRVQLIAGTSPTGRIVNEAAKALQNVPDTPAAELEKILAAGRIVEGSVVEPVEAEKS